ncbi:MAG: disulfide bond formation protein B [Rhizobiales bacterium]|nr:disulfide bond formation protein B [Hyphomicrobiales bacterium]
MTTEPSTTLSTPTGSGWTFLVLAWCVALVSTLAALFVGEVMGQVPCNLCWYQRAFMFPLAIILAVAAYRSDTCAVVYATPLAVGGWLVAAFHTLLYAGVIPEGIEPCGVGPSCSGADMTVGGVLPLPVVSLAAFTLIIAFLQFATRRPAR